MGASASVPYHCGQTRSGHNERFSPARPSKSVAAADVIASPACHGNMPHDSVSIYHHSSAASAVTIIQNSDRCTPCER